MSNSSCLASEARRHGLVVVVWSYPRGSQLSKEGETAVDICGYAVQIAAELGAHIIKVKLPTAHVEQDEARKVYEAQKIPIGTLAQRVAHVVQCAFNGRRIVIFSGGTFHDEAAILEEVRAIHEGGGFGSVMGRNMFQRPKADALRCLGRSWRSTQARSRNRPIPEKATGTCWPLPVIDAQTNVE